jgi:RimJ/RimL family protein N-acetyltransferase
MLSGNLVNLVPLEENHIDDIMKGWNNPEMRKFLGGYIPHTREAEKEWIQSAQQQMKRMSSFYFVIEDAKDSRFIGSVSLNSVNWVSRTSGIGITIHNPKDWEKGYGSEAMQLLLDFGWNHLNLRRIDLSVHSFNKRAQHVYEKLGFKVYGTAHRKFFIDGQYHDTIYMEIFRDKE